MSKNGTIVNEWEKLAALSNRRLKYQSLTLDVKFDWSIDRITIVGKLKENLYYHTELDVLILNFEQLMRLNENNGYLKNVGANSWQLIDVHGENIAYIEMLKYQNGYGRIDFNPNKINKFLASSMKNFIHDLFLEPHFSRADIACDMIDVPDDFITQYRVVDPISFKPIYGRSGKLETAYWGSRSSERQVRMYNKKLEQEQKRKIVPSEIKSWWRFELQLRRGKANNWHDMVHESLNSFASPHFLPPEIKPTERIMIKGLLYDHSEWGNLAKNTKKKYRDILKEESLNDELTKHLRETFKESSSELKKELDTWLQGLDVSEDN
ncbi:replication initiation factor domain-containing protein [Enterococcus italicus]|nr:replication initiation factor domain-containing protein [Enterococcus italicus]MCM6882087.1 replication initiation factor domain-containing protein [Enterococcus italicus]